MGCFCSMCLCGMDDDDDTNIQVKKLTLEKTGMQHVDSIFTEAAKPFNETIDVVNEYRASITQLKLMTGHRKRHSLMVVFTDLKKTKYPDLKVEVQDGPKFELQPGEAKTPTPSTKAFAEKLTAAFAGIGELMIKIEDLFKGALKSGETLVSESSALRDKIREEGVDATQCALGLSHVIYDVNQFRKIPLIYSAVKNSFEELQDELTEISKEMCRLDEIAASATEKTPATDDTTKDAAATEETADPPAPKKDGEPTETTQLLDQ
ncbi:uncharacterized protein LOC144450908 [Glandiceps talaboti]